MDPRSRCEMVILDSARESTWLRAVSARGARDHVSGPENALVTLVEYGDFECPHCGRAYPIVERLQKNSVLACASSSGTSRSPRSIRMRNTRLKQQKPPELRDTSARCTLPFSGINMRWATDTSRNTPQRSGSSDSSFRTGACRPYPCAPGSRGLPERRAERCERDTNLLYQRIPPRRRMGLRQPDGSARSGVIVAAGKV